MTNSNYPRDSHPGVALVCRRVNYYRVMAGLGVTELAEMSGMTPPTVSRICVGSRSMSLGAAFTLAEALKVPFRNFLEPLAEEEVEEMQEADKKLRRRQTKKASDAAAAARRLK